MEQRSSVRQIGVQRARYSGGYVPKEVPCQECIELRLGCAVIVPWWAWGRGWRALQVVEF